MSYRTHADLGGQAIFDRVVPEEEGALFHAPWERQALALTLAMGATGMWNIDMSRSARETLPDYRSLTYYQIWTKGLEKLLTEHQLVGTDELAQGQMLRVARQVHQVLRASDVGAALSRGSPTLRSGTLPARFAVGDAVRTRTAEFDHHTRLPRYVRGKVGRVEQLRGVHVFADAHAQGKGEQPQWLYCVVFSGRELWGDAAVGSLSVSIDAWEPYLEPVT